MMMEKQLIILLKILKIEEKVDHAGGSGVSSGSNFSIEKKCLNYITISNSFPQAFHSTFFFSSN